MFLLPGLAKHDDACAARIQLEHGKIRTAVAQIGIGLYLHIARETHMLALADFLRAHAKTEEAPLYAWADTSVPASHFAMLRQKIRAPWDRIAVPNAGEGRDAITPMALTPQ